MESGITPSTKPSFLAFYLAWAKRQNWDVPDFHVLVCHWLETRGDLAVLMMPRGHAKSTILGVYNAWRYYVNPRYRILHQGDQDGTAYKTSRDTKSILQRHPWTREMVLRGEISFWWVEGNDDERNPSMQAAGILSNITSSRADEIQNDDVEVPKNIATPEAREKLRFRLSEQIHILVPGGRHLFVGTPHTHETVYEEQIALGADALILRMFKQEFRIEKAGKSRHELPFIPEFVFSGIHKGARLLKAGVDYRMEGRTLVLASPGGELIDCYAGALWPERFTAEELLKRRQRTKTINLWDSQYQLHAKPIQQIRLDPARITPYAVDLTIRRANDAVSLFLGKVQVVAAACRWDPSSGKLKSDLSGVGVVLQDDGGRRYIHRVAAVRGEIAEFDEDGKTIIGGQVWQLCDLIKELHIPRVSVETNGIGGFAPTVLRAAIKQRKLQCAVVEVDSTSNKNKRILEAFEPLLLSRGMLWAHMDVLIDPDTKGKAIFWTQMRDWNPAVAEQPDDLLDAVSGAIGETPERFRAIGGNSPAGVVEDWRPTAGVYEVAFER